MKGLPWIPAEWSAHVPSLITAASRRWGLTPRDHLGGLASSVMRCVDHEGRDVVLKVAPAEARPALEAAALLHWDGHGAPRLVAFADDLGALLMEAVRPGTPLPPGDDAAAVALAADTLRRLHGAPVPRRGTFPSHAEFFGVWLERVHLSGESGTAGMRLLPAAIAAAERLDATKTRAVLLHGDFIDKNLLRGENGYVAVDPLPRIGDPCSDVGFFAAYHPPASGIAARVRALALAIGADVERAERWAALWAVGEATETWRADSDELQEWVNGPEARDLLMAPRS